jgi:hypothetical protein
MYYVLEQHGSATVSLWRHGSFNLLLEHGTGTSIATATGLTAGNYNVTVTDANGCSKVQSVLITQPLER